MRRHSGQRSGRRPIERSSQQRHGFSAPKPCVGKRLRIWDEPGGARHHSVVLWSRGCQVSGEYWGGSQRVDFGSRSRAAAVDVEQSSERPSIRVENSVVVSNTQCCMRDRTQSAAQDGANPSLFRFRVSGSPRPNAVASTRDNFRFDFAGGKGLLPCFTKPRPTHIAWGEGGWG
jgi:hypothetical protein